MQSGFLPCGDKGILIIIPGMLGFLLLLEVDMVKRRLWAFSSTENFGKKWKNNWTKTKFMNNIFHVN